MIQETEDEILLNGKFLSLVAEPGIRIIQIYLLGSYQALIFLSETVTDLGCHSDKSSETSFFWSLSARVLQEK